MKRLTVILLSIFALSLISRADDRPITFEQLPSAAKTFIQKNFSKAKVLIATVDDELIRPDYEVVLDNGFEIQFENDGSLEKIEARNADIPLEIIPAQIREYVNANFPNNTFKEYEVGLRSYEVTLSNRLELKFNSNFVLIEIDD